MHLQRVLFFFSIFLLFGIVSSFFSGVFFFGADRTLVFNLYQSSFEEKLPYPFVLSLKSEERGDGDLFCNSQVFNLENGKIEPIFCDIRSLLSYHGVNNRPDNKKGLSRLYFSLPGSEKPVPVVQNAPLYLTCNNRSLVQSFSFSKDNEKTPLYIQAALKEDKAEVEFFIEGVEKPVDKEVSFAHFILSEKEWSKKQDLFSSTHSFEIGRWKVDATLLSKQSAKWWGKDRFLEVFGGQEYSFTLGKERVDFGEGENLYSVFIEQGNCLIWADEQWKVVEPGPETYGKPLLYVKRIDERIMQLDLWDEAGAKKTCLTLLKTLHTPHIGDHLDTLKFIGAHTRQACAFEIEGERVLLSPNDWLLFTEEGCVKITDEEELDAFIQGRVKGQLFVFQGILKKEEHQIAQALLFNAARTQIEEIEIAVNKGSKPVRAPHLENSSNEIDFMGKAQF